MKFVWVFVALLFVSLRVMAAATDDDAKVIPFGEDLTSTSYVLKKGTCTIGFQVTGCGLTRNFTLGTSPWLWSTYNSINLEGRLHFGDESGKWRQALQFDYIKSFSVRTKDDGYEMEVYWLSYIRSYLVTADYTAHFNIQAMYYANDFMPFSMRRAWVDRRSFQFNLSALNEVHVVNGFYINAEFGVLGFTQNNPDFLLGVTFEYRLASWQFHFGICQTGTAAGYARPNRRADYQSNLLSAPNGFATPKNGFRANYDYAIHPDATIQYYF